MQFRSIPRLSVFSLSLAVSFVSLGCHSTGPSQGAMSPATTQPMNATVLPTRSMPEIAAAAKKDLYWLADDAREGRGLGTQGLQDSGQFIADRFKQLGLLPVPSIGSYFEPFDFDAGMTVGPGTKLTINGKPVDKDDFTGFGRSKAADVTAPLAFVGYGAQSKDHDYDDYAGIDVKGRIVLAMRWEPHNAQGKSQWGPADGQWSAEAAIARKVDHATKAGAAALILVNAPTFHDDAERVMDSHGGLRRPGSIPVFHVSTSVANEMLKAANAGVDLATLQKSIDDSGKPASRLLDGASVEADLRLVKESNGVRNVVAMLPGYGPHASEYVIVGAHYDHIGRGAYGSMVGPGQIHNGADDNGSGTTALLQLAQEFALAGRQDRSIIFVTFSLEELGLIGSRAFVDKLPVPKESVVGMLNMDMVGRMKNEYVYVGGDGTSDAFASILAAADARSPVELKSMGKGGLGPSDHLNFSRVKIPCLFLFTGMHPDYHAPGDDAYKINYEGISQVVWLAFDIVHQMCDMPEDPYVAKYDNREPDTEVKAGELPTTQPTQARVVLGIMPSLEQDPSVKGLKIDQVTEKHDAAVAGMKDGDILTKIDDHAIESLYDLRKFLRTASPGDKVTLTVRREGKDVRLPVTFTEP